MEAHKEIKQVNPCPVLVMMTGIAVEGLIVETLQEGAHAVLYRPFEMEQIIDLVRSFLNIKRVLLVYDHAADRAILGYDGYEVHEAADGP